ncbi:MAG: hypothetical protein II942_02745 [Alphaproteobacteria bacterium]|nr:hypothetical protein [Alphaproteobacteria bacterium]
MAKESKKEPEEVETPEVPAAEETKPQKKRSGKKKFFVFLLVLGLLAASGVVGYTYVAPLAQSIYDSFQSDEGVPEPEAVVTPTPEIEPAVEEDQFLEPELPQEPQPVEEVSEEPVVVEEEVVVEQTQPEPIPELSPEPVQIVPEPVVELQPEPVQPQPVVKQKPLSITHPVMKVMELKEAFQNNGQCRPILEELMAMPEKTPKMDRALMDLLQTCLDKPLKGQMKETFNAAKRRAILRSFQSENPSWTAYLQALPYLLADIHQKNPTDDTPLSILDRIQNAVNADKPVAVLDLIPQLPQSVQAVLFDLQQSAQEEATLYKNLNQLMKALFAEGGNND